MQSQDDKSIIFTSKFYINIVFYDTKKKKKTYLKAKVLNQNISIRCHQWNMIKPVCSAALEKSSCLKAANTACLLRDLRNRARLQQYFIQHTVSVSSC